MSQANDTCRQTQQLFSLRLDGDLPGRTMLAVDAHIAACLRCRAEFAGWQQMQNTLSSLGTISAPPQLALGLRVALSQARARSMQTLEHHWQLQWSNTVRPLAIQWSAGLALAVALLAGVGLMVGIAAAPVTAQASSAHDEPLGLTTSPHYLYSLLPSAPIHALQTDVDTAVVVEAFLGTDGRVYDYKIVAGEDTPAVRTQLNNVLFFAVFAPAKAFGRPVAGYAVMSFAGVAVRG